MSLYRGPEEHAANPPETWSVVKVAERVWYVQDRNGTQLERATTKREATQLLTDGSARTLYEKEGRWYAGETITGWKSWAECKAERERNAARWGKPCT